MDLLTHRYGLKYVARFNGSVDLDFLKSYLRSKETLSRTSHLIPRELGWSFMRFSVAAAVVIALRAAKSPSVVISITTQQVICYLRVSMGSRRARKWVT